jgi:hypothetical protein
MIAVGVLEGRVGLQWLAVGLTVLTWVRSWQFGAELGLGWCHFGNVMAEVADGYSAVSLAVFGVAGVSELGKLW